RRGEQRCQASAAVVACTAPVKARPESRLRTHPRRAEFSRCSRRLSRMSLRPELGRDCDGRAAPNTYLEQIGDGPHYRLNDQGRRLIAPTLKKNFGYDPSSIEF